MASGEQSTVAHSEIEMIATGLTTAEATRLWALTAERDRFREALERLARLGNEPLLGNSRGNMIAREALGL